MSGLIEASEVVDSVYQESNGVLLVEYLIEKYEYYFNYSFKYKNYLKCMGKGIL